MFKAYTDFVTVWRFEEYKHIDGMLLPIMVLIISETGDFRSASNEQTKIILRPGRKISRKAFYRLTKFYPVAFGIKDEDTKP